MPILDQHQNVQEDRGRLPIGDVQLRLTPLEEVFMAVTREAEIKHAQQTRQTTELKLDNTATLQVRF